MISIFLIADISQLISGRGSHPLCIIPFDHTLAGFSILYHKLLMAGLKKRLKTKNIPYSLVVCVLALVVVMCLGGCGRGCDIINHISHFSVLPRAASELPSAAAWQSQLIAGSELGFRTQMPRTKSKHTPVVPAPSFLWHIPPPASPPADARLSASRRPLRSGIFPRHPPWLSIRPRSCVGAVSELRKFNVAATNATTAFWSSLRKRRARI